ncbi:MAG: DUF5615 family PIN-like protein [Chloroflexota bacterium]
MTGLGIRLYTDEDVDRHLALQLRRHGYPILSCFEAGNAGRKLTDEWQLAFAVQQERAILIHNIVDYFPLDAAWKARGREHAGIIAVPQNTSFGDLVRRVRLHLDTVSPEQQYNLIRFLAR